MLKSMVVILAMFGSVSAQAGLGRIVVNAVQDHKAVGIGGNDFHDGAVQDQKAVSVESQVETAKLLDLNEGF